MNDQIFPEKYENPIWTGSTTIADIDHQKNSRPQEWPQKILVPFRKLRRVPKKVFIMTAMFVFFVVFLISFLTLKALPVDETHYTNLGRQKGNFLEGDIKLNLRGRIAIRKAERWTDGIIPYEIQEEHYNAEQIKMIHDAIATIERHTCIKFVKHTNENNSILIRSDGYCYSDVGMVGDQQTVSLASRACFVFKTVIHELLHAVGLWHEQSRYDRDDYLAIHWEWISASVSEEYAREQLKIINETDGDTYGVPYNYASVMEYDAWALGDGKPGHIVMMPKDAYMLSVMGFAKTANESDFEKVRRLYDCEGQYPQVPPADIPCEDTRPDLCKPEDTDLCDKDYYMVQVCRKTCGYCEWGSQITATPRPFCEDYRTDCHSYVKQCLNDSTPWVARACPFSCGFCDRSKTRLPLTTTTDAPCVDTFNFCEEYESECGKQRWMESSCRLTCKLCTPSSEDLKNGLIRNDPKAFCEDTRDDCDRYIQDCPHQFWMKKECRFTCGFCDKSKTRTPVTTTTEGPCEDRYTHCQNYLDKCNHENWTYKNCRKSCGYCH